MKIAAVICMSLLWCAAALAQATKPRILEKAPPAYPPAEEQARHGGRVEVRASVNDQGGVDGVEVLRGTGYPALDQAAIDAVGGWKFAPAKDADGKAVAGVVSFALTFTPPGRDVDVKISCGEVTQQVAALRAAAPHATVDQVPALGALMDLAQSADEALPPKLQGLVTKEMPSLYDQLLETCAANPGANMMDTYYRILKDPDSKGAK